MVKNGNRITIEKVYTLIGEIRRELTDSIIRLETKFDVLEQGRLSAIETKVANLEGRIFTAASIIAIGISGVIALFSFLIRR